MARLSLRHHSSAKRLVEDHHLLVTWPRRILDAVNGVCGPVEVFVIGMKYLVSTGLDGQNRGWRATRGFADDVVEFGDDNIKNGTEGTFR
jgi:hypothetical protein